MTTKQYDIKIDNDKIDQDAAWIIKRLTFKGYDAYFTGGCVRDLILKNKPKDFDIATSASPRQIKKVFPNSRLIGRRFLLAHIYFENKKFIETSTFRCNPNDESTDESAELLVKNDNSFGSMEEDALRRDFTVNGLFYDLDKNTVIDFVDGEQDLENKLIRCIGTPSIRFQEDPVRILRAIRFAAKLDFDIESETYEAMTQYVSHLLKCSPARLREEIGRLFVGGYGQKAYKLACKIGVMEQILPEIEKALSANLGLASLEDLVIEDKENIANKESGEEEDEESQNNANIAISDDNNSEITKELSDKIISNKQSLFNYEDIDDIKNILKDEALSSSKIDVENPLLLQQKMLEALDEVFTFEVNISTALFFSVLLLPSYQLLKKSPIDESEWIKCVCKNLSHRIKLTKADQETIKVLLASVELLSSEKIEPQLVNQVVDKFWFREALLFYSIYSLATEQSFDRIELWKYIADRLGKKYKQYKFGEEIKKKQHLNWRKKRPVKWSK